MEEKKKDIYFFIVLGLMFIGGYTLLLYILELSGMIIFVNRVSMFQRYIAYLGSSVYFFCGDIILLLIGFVMLFKYVRCASSYYSEVRFWDAVTNIAITLFFGIGVIYTAVGMHRAFQIALGNIDQEMVSSLGPWRILANLVDGGLIMALLTTIVGGALGYSFRVIKFLIFGKSLIVLKEKFERKPYQDMIDKLANIEKQLAENNKISEELSDG